MNLGQFRTTTRYYLDDNSAARWSDAEVNYYINRAYRHYYNKLVNLCYRGLITTPVLIDLANGQAEYALPSDFLKGDILYRYLPSTKTGATQKEPCHYKDNYDTIIILTPTFTGYIPMYSFRGMNILLMPPSAEDTVEALELHYWPSPTTMSADVDIPAAGFNAAWHDMVPIKAAIMAKAFREEEDVTNLMNDLAISEQPFNDMCDSLMISRRRTEPFNTQQDDNYFY